MGIYFRIAARNLWRRKRRTLILGLAIFVVTFLLTITNAFLNGIGRTVMNTATTLASGHVNVEGYYKISRGHATLAMTDYAAVKKTLEKEVPGVRKIVDRVSSVASFVSPRHTGKFSVSGLDFKDEPRLRKLLKITKGDLNELDRPNNVLLFERQAKRFGVAPGDVLIMMGRTIRGEINAVDVRVAAVAKGLGVLSSSYIYTSKETMRSFLQLRPGTTGRLMIEMNHGVDANRVADAVHRKLSAKGHRVLDREESSWNWVINGIKDAEWKGQKLGVSTWRGTVKFLLSRLKMRRQLLWLITGILLFLIVMGVMNTLWIVIRERTREIGALRAIGMGRPGVMWMIMLESAILSLFATLAGMLVAVSAVEIVNAMEIAVSAAMRQEIASNTLKLVITPRLAFLSVAVICGANIIFSIFPAYRAARLRPVVAMRHAG